MAAKRTEAGGGTARTEALDDARSVELHPLGRSDLRLHGEDEANQRCEGAATTDWLSGGAMRSGLMLLLARKFDAKPSPKDALLVPFAARGAALNLLALERAWFDGREWLMRMARGAG
jgi:hypothetical protein